MTVVIQYANAYFNLKNQDFWCGRLRTDQDRGPSGKEVGAKEAP